MKQPLSCSVYVLPAPPVRLMFVWWQGMYQRAKDGLHLVKVWPGSMGARLPRKYICVCTHTHTQPTHTHTHMHTHSPTHTCTLNSHIHPHIYICTHADPTLPLICNIHILLPFNASGKVNLENAVTRWKWGVGRLIAESTKTPIVVPLWHVGIEDILPTRSPYIPQLFKVRVAKHTLKAWHRLISCRSIEWTVLWWCISLIRSSFLQWWWWCMCLAT